MSLFSVGAGRGGAAPGAGAHPPPGEGEERPGGSDQRHGRQAGRGRADGSEGRQEDHPEVRGKGTESPTWSISTWWDYHHVKTDPLIHNDTS